MSSDYKVFLLRFLIGGVVVSLFSMVAEVVRPKTFAGLFGAAPSIALATLGLTIAQHGKDYAALEARSMILGAIGFFCYATASSWILIRFKPSAMVVTVCLLPFWFLTSIALWFFLLG